MSVGKVSIQQFNGRLRALVHSATLGKQTQDLVATQQSLQRAADALAARIAKRTSEKLCRTTPAVPSTRR